MRASRPKVLMVGPWPPAKGGVTTFMRNVTSSPLKEKYDFIPFTTSRPEKRDVKGDNYGYRAVFRGGFNRRAQGLLITLWPLFAHPSVVMVWGPARLPGPPNDLQAFLERPLYVSV